MGGMGKAGVRKWRWVFGFGREVRLGAVPSLDGVHAAPNGNASMNSACRLVLVSRNRMPALRLGDGRAVRGSRFISCLGGSRGVFGSRERRRHTYRRCLSSAGGGRAV